MPRPARALLLLAMVLAAPALPAQAAPDHEVPSHETQPAELLAVGEGWLAAARAARASVLALPGANASVVDVFLEGGADFVNESRLTLAATQLYQVDVQARFQRFVAAGPEDEAPAVRRDRALAVYDAEAVASRAALDAFEARLANATAALRTTHGAEYAVYAAMLADVGEGFLAQLPDLRERVRNSTAPDDALLRYTLAFALASQSYARFAGDVLDLAVRADADPARPPLPEGGALVLGRAAERRFIGNPAQGGYSGPLSGGALERLKALNATEDPVRYAGRFLALQQARAADALEFLKQRGQVFETALAENLRVAATNASYIATYDARLTPTEPPGMLATARAAGYQGVLQVDAINHALYRVHWDPRADGMIGAWGQLVAAAAASELEAEAATPAQPAAGADWLVYGGVAVAAALGVAAVVLLRKPGA